MGNDQAKADGSAPANQASAQAPRVVEEVFGFVVNFHNLIFFFAQLDLSAGGHPSLPDLHRFTDLKHILLKENFLAGNFVLRFGI